MPDRSRSDHEHDLCDDADFKCPSRDGKYRIKGNQAPAGDNLIVVVKSKESGRDDCKGAVADAKAEEHVE